LQTCPALPVRAGGQHPGPEPAATISLISSLSEFFRDAIAVSAMWMVPVIGIRFLY
jgi:hypothetical protein